MTHNLSFCYHTDMTTKGLGLGLRVRLGLGLRLGLGIRLELRLGSTKVGVLLIGFYLQ